MIHPFASRNHSAMAFIAVFLTLATAIANTSAEEPAPLKLVQTVALKGPAGRLDHVALDSNNQRLFLAHLANNSLDVVDLRAGKLLKRITGQQGVQGLAYAPDLDRIFVGIGTGGFCNIFDGKDYKLLKTIKFADDADNVRYDPKRNLVYVAHAEKALGVIDAKTFEIRADVKLPGQIEGFQLDSNRPRIYLNIPSPSQVAVIDTEKNEVAGSYPLHLASANYPLAVDSANHRLLIGCRKAPMVIVLDSESGKEITSIPIAGDIDDLFYDAKRKRIYASCGEGFISVIRQIDADHYEAGAKIATAKGARTSIFDADTGRYYLAVPRQSGKSGPEIWVYQARP
jgi:DNA-binding beta-propeller fold protein YncE